MIAHLRTVLACTRGAAAVEFAIVSVVFVALCIGIVDFGRTLYVKNQLAALADEASRQILLDPGISSATLEADLAASFTAGDPSDLTVAINTEVNGPRTYRVVDIGYPITLLIPNIADNQINLSISRRVPAG